VLQAHNHLYERTWPAWQGGLVKKDYDRPGAPVYVTAGGGSDYLYQSVIPPAEWTAFRATEFQHLVITLDDGTLRVESTRPDGTVLDEFQIVKDVPPPSSDVGPTPTEPPQQPQPPPSSPGGSVTAPAVAASGGGCGTGGGGALAIALVGAVLAWTRRGTRPRR
jgi:hypothetical protein